MLKRLIAIAVIYCGAGLAWLILGSTLEVRTAQSDVPQQQRLLSQWGSPQTQSAPQINRHGEQESGGSDPQQPHRR